MPDPHDRRRVLVEPTPESPERVARLYAPLTDRLHAHLAALDTDQLAARLEFATAAQASTDAEIRDLGAG
ncbi:hypothetical protein [Pseudonocardia abyssalis]|uniref:MarR family transcriptional regulator n=1 Tax=Pseudonocardia abyssalis TaxID=2792008 RepID=A0ABS6V0B4_9PSEU|nr:hypothetical protein [Pseudonocardia abyssalis]MBW0115123.1 hypothetical protein [Pseudonocardia abyssalis]MBW0137962.1 hypothetical protein [Pseudonocardia abyssalis]